MSSALRLALALAVSLGSLAEAARIRGVQEQTETRSAPLSNSLQGRRMPKFSDERAAVVTRFDVEWEAEEGEQGPLVVQLHYRTAVGSDAPVQVLNRPYAKVTPGRRTAVFSLPVGERPAAWRVRVVQDRKTLVERASATWE